MIRRILDKVFVRDKHVCPWWLCWTFDNVCRRWVQDPEKIVKPYIRKGSIALDIGCGMGYFTIPLARLVRERGQVIAIDIQEQMLSALQRRAKRAGLEKRIVLQRNTQDSLKMDTAADFALAFWMVHEVPDRVHFLEQIKFNLKPGGLFLLVEPTLHVKKEMYEETVRIAQEIGFILQSNPHIIFSRSALFSARKWGTVVLKQLVNFSSLIMWQDRKYQTRGYTPSEGERMLTDESRVMWV